VRLLGSDFGPGSAGGLGTAGTHRFTFEPVQEGDAEIVAEYARAWEGAPARTKVFRVHVSGGN
jgi:predicted secreted protein